MDILFTPAEQVFLDAHRWTGESTIEPALHRTLAPLVAPADVTPVSVPLRWQTTIDLVPPDPRGYGSVPTQGFTFALQNYAGGEGYVFPGSALTASTRAWHGEEALTGTIVRATWRLVWNPLGDVNAGAQLSHTAPGPTDEQIIAAFTNRSEETPIHTEQDVTGAIQALHALGVRRYLCHKVRGAVIVFGSSLELVWQWSSSPCEA